tara:strand:+ start:327 stop:449 length:123 start_codon:yes stop_codon:yes gene_type:complete
LKAKSIKKMFLLFKIKLSKNISEQGVAARFSGKYIFDCQK